MRQVYTKTALSLGKLFDDTNALKVYNNQLIEVVKKEYCKRNLDIYSYERLINILTCVNLHVDEMKNKLNDFIEVQGKLMLKVEEIYS